MSDVPVFIDWNEWYPVYSAVRLTDRRYKPKFYLTEEELADYKRVLKEFNDWQEKLRRMRYPDE